MQVVKGDHYSNLADLFSFAMTILQFCLKETDLLAFLKEKYSQDNNKNCKEPNLSRISHDVVVKGWRPDISGIKGVPKCLVDLLGLCWANDPELRPSFGEIVDYVQAEVRNEVMGTEGGGPEGSPIRRTSTSGGLAMRITVAKSKKEEQGQAKEEEEGELDKLRIKCAELERELKEVREGEGSKAGK